MLYYRAIACQEEVVAGVADKGTQQSLGIIVNAISDIEDALIEGRDAAIRNEDYDKLLKQVNKVLEFIETEDFSAFVKEI